MIEISAAASSLMAVPTGLGTLRQGPRFVQRVKAEKRGDIMSNSKSTDGDYAENTGTTDNRFGYSLESQAQFEDATEIARGTAAGETLNVYRLEPVAAPDDPRWQNAPAHGTVVVAARTAGDARIVAAGAELDFMEIDALPAEDVSTLNASAFRDEKLYTVIEVEHGRQGLTRGVMGGDVRIDTIKPVQI